MFFSPKAWQERGLKNIQKTSTRKVRKNVKKVVQKDVPKSDLFVIFLDLGPKAPQGAPKDPYKHRPRSNLIENGTKMVCIILFL